MEAPKTLKEAQDVTWMTRNAGWHITAAAIQDERERLRNRLTEITDPTEIYRTQGKVAAFSEVLAWVENRVSQVEKGE